MATKITPEFPPVRACIFDMDGLLINSEDIITLSINQLLRKYERPILTPSIRAQLMGVPNSTNGDLFHDWAELPISREQFAQESAEQMRLNFPNCEPLPGAGELLENLNRASNASGDKIALALASGTKTRSYELKISRPDTRQLLSIFQPVHRVLGDDPRVQGRAKPAPDIYLVALQSLNATAGSGENIIKPNEGLVFEDSVVGVEAARRAGMRVVWIPHPDVAVEYRGKEKDVFTRRAGVVGAGDMEDHDGWSESIQSLREFDYAKYGIIVAH